MRYLPLTSDDRQAMLARIGVASVDALFKDVPEAARLSDPVDLPHHQSELAVDRYMRQLAGRNMTAGEAAFFCGGGAYRHHVPATVDHIIQRSEFLTSYTPYQPEITQGTLQYLFEFQTQVAELTGMDVANASMYDGSTAAAEAVLMAHRVTKKKKAVISGRLHPHYRDVINNISEMGGFDVAGPSPSVAGEEGLGDMLDSETSCVVVQYPDFFGSVQDFTALAERVHAQNALLVVIVTEAVSLGLLRAPGDMGADIVAGEGQSIGNGLNFGGPYVGLFATRQKYLRQMPGRLCGETVDADGKRGFVLTLSTREQHIRRDKATSNICTNSGLCALAFTVHMTLLGGAGLAHLAALNHERMLQLVGKLSAIGLSPLNQAYFNEITIALPKAAAPVVDALAGQKILAGIPVARLLPDSEMDNCLLLAVTETTTAEDMDQLVEALKEHVA
jgi:glycine dehydrogenase subunit 1